MNDETEKGDVYLVRLRRWSQHGLALYALIIAVIICAVTNADI